jgi:hypothetical protein
MKRNYLTIYLILSGSAFLCIFIQILLAGIAFTQDYTYWELHKTFALFKYIYLIIFIVGLVGKLPKTQIWLAIILFAIANIQYYTAHGFLPFLHVVIPLVIFWLNLEAVRKTFKFYRVRNN